MSKLLLLGAFGAGYVLGAKAGRERYEQIARTARKVRSDPRVQDAAHRATEKATDVAKDAAPVVKDKVTQAAGVVADKARSAAPGSASAAGTGSGAGAPTELNPESTIYQEHPYPQGDLP